MIYYKNSDELYHHGILGQKWGVRRYQNPDGTLTDAGKKRYMNESTSINSEETSEDDLQRKKDFRKKIIIGAAATAAIIATTGTIVYLKKTKDYSTSINVNSLKLGRYKLEDMTISDDLILPKDSLLYRTSSHTNFSNGPVFMSTNISDKNRYIHRMTAMKHKPMYQMRIKTSKDFKIPSEQKQFDMFVDLLEKNEKFSSEITFNPYGKTKRVLGNRSEAKKFAEFYHYQNFITKMIDYDPSKSNVLSIFADYVKSQGFDGLVDINDIRTTADKPIIALDPSDLIIDSTKLINPAMKFISGLMLEKVKL